MKQKVKTKENIFNKIGENVSSHPVLSSLVISMISALYLSLIVLNFDRIITALQIFIIAVFIIPGAILCVVIGLYLGILLHRKEIKESITGDNDFYFRIGSVVFFHSWMRDDNLKKTFPSVIGPCCPICGEGFWGADKLENNSLIFNCRKCNHSNTVQLEEYENIKTDADRTLQKAYERLTKFRDKLKVEDESVSEIRSDKNE